MNYHKGKFYPKNPEKYIGDINNIIFRSSYERKLLSWLDETPNILKYGSEEVPIKYISPIDNKIHTYWPDFIVVYKNRSGEIKKAIFEVKPEKQMKPPKLPKSGKQTKSFLYETATYVINNAKWKAAKEFCIKHNLEFRLITEKELGIK